MNGFLDAAKVPSAANVKNGTSLREVTVKNVLKPIDGEKDVTVKIIPFNRRNDAHVKFAYDFVDMLGKAPSAFSTQSDAARAYVDIFVARTGEDLDNPESDFNCIRNDLRACRYLMGHEDFVKEFNDFFDLG